MNTAFLAQEAVETGNPILNISIFIAFIVITLTIVVRATRQTSQKGTDFYTGGASFNGTQNGLAIAGDYLSAAAFLGVTGAIAGRATTDSCTPSASSSRCWSPSCSSPSRCATPAASPWPTCCRSA